MDRRNFLKGLAGVSALVAAGFAPTIGAKLKKNPLLDGKPSSGDELEQAKEIPGVAHDTVSELQEAHTQLDAVDLRIDPVWVHQKLKDTSGLQTLPPGSFTSSHPPTPSKRVLAFESIYGPIIICAIARENPDYWMLSDGTWIHATEFSRATSERDLTLACGGINDGQRMYSPEAMPFSMALEKRRQYDAESRAA